MGCIEEEMEKVKEEDEVSWKEGLLRGGKESISKGGHVQSECS